MDAQTKQVVGVFNINNSHWVALRIYKVSRTVQIFDSLSTSARELMREKIGKMLGCFGQSGREDVDASLVSNQIRSVHYRVKTL